MVLSCFAKFGLINVCMATLISSVHAQEESSIVKMCLFYPNAAGHARTDPILNQACASDHVHTFYGPLNFHPNTTYEDLRDTKPQHSSSPFVENQSLYWHPSIYQVTTGDDAQTIYNRVNEVETSPYYRWDMTTAPETVAFPPGFRMIAYSNDVGAGMGGENGENLFVECCDLDGDDEDCEETVGHPLIFPTRTCDFLGIAFAMPTCWDESKGIGTEDPFSHVAYTKDGTVSGPCPDGYGKRLPQIQLFVRINNYKGGLYQLADGSDAFHVDFMNGWKEGKLQKILDECVPSGEMGYNPPCDCTHLLTETEDPSPMVCNDDVKRYILDEEADIVIGNLPRGTCQGMNLTEKTWEVTPPFQCFYEIEEEDWEDESSSSLITSIVIAVSCILVILFAYLGIRHANKKVDDVPPAKASSSTLELRVD